MSPNIQHPLKFSLFATPAACQLPVGFPDVDGLRVCDTVLQSLLIQQVKKVLNSQRYRSTGAEDCSKQIIHKLLQSPLTQTKTTMSATTIFSNNSHILNRNHALFLSNFHCIVFIILILRQLQIVY